MKLAEGTGRRLHTQKEVCRAAGRDFLGLFTRRACILIVISELGGLDRLFNLRNDTVNSSSPARFIYIAFAR